MRAGTPKLSKYLVFPMYFQRINGVYVNDALKEAYVTGDPVIFECLELLHDDFPAPMRISNARQDVIATLEDSAPANPGETVTFLNLPFNLVQPKVETNPQQGFEIQVSNIDQQASSLLDIAVENPTPILVIYRLYVAGDLSGPANDPPDQFTIHTARANKKQVTANARSYDIINRRFPNIIYDADNFPGLLT